MYIFNTVQGTSAVYESFDKTQHAGARCSHMSCNPEHSLCVPGFSPHGWFVELVQTLGH